MATVVIAGATGFVGRSLAKKLAGQFRVIGLTRKAWRAEQLYPDLGIEWRDCDLFSLRDAVDAIEGADFAVYLVHSMAPSARLTQAKFEDLDLILADNFARACRLMNVQQIVYLGGIVSRLHHLSPHLRSRIEVEDALSSHGVPLTALRAGLVMGAHGSSFEILVRLVRRLPLVGLPKWTRTPMSPIAEEDVVELLSRCVGDRRAFGVTSDVGCTDPLTYEELIRETAKGLGLKRVFVPAPLVTPKLSTRWVQLITGCEYELVAPLVESLTCPMVAEYTDLQDRLNLSPRDARSALRAAIDDRLADEAAQIEKRPTVLRPPALAATSDEHAKEVRSVQRLRTTNAMTAQWIAREYQAWLPNTLRPFLQVRELGDDSVGFFFRPLKKPLLVLSLALDRSNRERALFYITGGMLADTSRSLRGRLEFRTVLRRHAALAAIHEFTPALPWPIYRWTQAVVHSFVMWRFGRHLRAIGEGRRAAYNAARLSDLPEGTLQVRPRARPGDDGFDDGPRRLASGEYDTAREPRISGLYPTVDEKNAPE